MSSSVPPSRPPPSRPHRSKNGGNTSNSCSKKTPKSTSTGSSSTNTSTTTPTTTTTPTANGTGSMLIRQWLYEIELQDCDTELVWETLCHHGIDSPIKLVDCYQSTTTTNPIVVELVGKLISSASDQRKLRLLIQRIQLLLLQQQQVSSKNASSTNSCMNNTNTVKQSVKKKSTTTNGSIPKENCQPLVTKEPSPTPPQQQQQPRKKLIKSASQLLDDVLSGTNAATVATTSNTTTTTTKSAKNSSLPRPQLRSTTTLADKLAKSERHLVPSSSNASVVSAATTGRPASTHRRQSVMNDRTTASSSGTTSRPRSRMSYHPSATTMPSSSSSSVHGNNSNNVGINSTNAEPLPPSTTSFSNMSSFKFQIESLRDETTREHDSLGGPTNATDPTSNDEMRIRVIVRKRPMTTTESNINNAGDIDIIHPLQYDQYGRILVYQPKTRVDLTKQIEMVPFAFDQVYDETSTNQQIYESSIRNLIPSFFVGQWASIFAYGQTGSGKTFTMMGNNFTGMNCTAPANVDVSNLGLYYMAALDIFHALQSPEYESYTIHVSLFEIYGGKLFDLLNGRAAVKCLEDSKGNVCFPGLSDHPVTNANELMNRIVEGATLRSTGTTSRNADSSRSHAVLQLHLYRKATTTIQRRRGTTTTTTISSSSSRHGKEEFSRLTFIDLAGSERGADTSTASRATRLEGAEINTSLLALKEVIRALATGDSLTHVPFRGSKLTQVLKQSFVGKNCRSVMIACISPNIGNCEQTLNTLRYADRVKERNPETGELSPSMMAATTSKVLTPTTKHSMSRMPSSFLSADQSYTSQKSDMLDELLASPPSSSGHDVNDDDIDALLDDNHNNASKLDPPSDVLHELITTHKDATEGMLEMIQEEMSLITVDHTTAQQFDQYLDRVYALQEEQLSMISMLRELLSQYRSMNHPPTVNTTASFHNHLVGDDTDNDDTFEDLRD